MPSDLLNYFYVIDENTHVHKPLPDPRSLAQTLAVRTKLDEGSEDFTEENRLISEKGLGYYTTEQEADEIGLELLAKIGVPGAVAIDLQLAFQRMYDAYAVSGETKWAKCKALRERDFKDEADKPVSVPIGNLSDPHHSNCFRAQNIARKLEAHKYVLGTRPTPPGDEWSRVITRLSTGHEPPPAKPTAPPASSSPVPSSTAPPPPPPGADAGR